jgi:hypothetical protein
MNPASTIHGEVRTIRRVPDAFRHIVGSGESVHPNVREELDGSRQKVAHDAHGLREPSEQGGIDERQRPSQSRG